MNSQTIGDKPFRSLLNFRSAEASASIPAGAPIIFVMNGTEDGFAAVLPSTAAAAKSPELFGGVYAQSLPLTPGVVGEAQVWGFCNYAVVVQQSRAASTDSFVSAAALSIGQPLAIDTVNNAFKIGNQVTGAFTVVTNATTDTVSMNFGDMNPPMAVMAQTLAAAVSSASTTSETRTKITYGLKVFLRAM